MTWCSRQPDALQEQHSAVWARAYDPGRHRGALGAVKLLGRLHCPAPVHIAWAASPLERRARQVSRSRHPGNGQGQETHVAGSPGVYSGWHHSLCRKALAPTRGAGEQTLEAYLVRLLRLVDRDYPTTSIQDMH